MGNSEISLSLFYFLFYFILFFVFIYSFACAVRLARPGGLHRLFAFALCSLSLVPPSVDVPEATTTGIVLQPWAGPGADPSAKQWNGLFGETDIVWFVSLN